MYKAQPFRKPSYSNTQSFRLLSHFQSSNPSPFIVCSSSRSNLTCLIDLTRAKDFISFMKENDLITEIDREDLPKAYSYKTRRFLRITNKGAAFLRGYRELRGMISWLPDWDAYPPTYVPAMNYKVMRCMTKSTHPPMTPQEKNQVENQGFLYPFMIYHEILTNTLQRYEELQTILVQIAKLSPVWTYNLARDMWVDRTSLRRPRHIYISKVINLWSRFY